MQKYKSKKFATTPRNPADALSVVCSTLSHQRRVTIGKFVFGTRKVGLGNTEDYGFAAVSFRPSESDVTVSIGLTSRASAILDVLASLRIIGNRDGGATFALTSSDRFRRQEFEEKQHPTVARAKLDWKRFQGLSLETLNGKFINMMEDEEDASWFHPPSCFHLIAQKDDAEATRVNTGTVEEL
ncbi:hypothetical protein BT96DRAFT_950241 [Gymnopus androsaceus JB14]|uniref:Uncharacterized protein n=1 Tax=Gymnopus androsaceus JB14 TaxID=1447944 RepID=A0A6A4GHE7_9AGAR|nr:hypothetical protein BT96DRAFT_950241 [Gymnopus androsaceus JB14]